MDIPNLEELEQDLVAYVTLKDQIGTLTKRQTEAKKRLVDAVDQYGEIDGRGHKVLELPNEVAGVGKLTQQRRVSKTLDMDKAYEILESKGDESLLNDCIEYVPTIDEEAVMAAFYKGQLTEADIDAMFPAKISYAFLV